MKSRTRAIAILFVAAMAPGCSCSVDTSAIPGGSQRSTADGGVEVKVGDTEVKVGGSAGLKLPADFPKDVPIYPGANIRFHAITGKGDQTSGMVNLDTRDPVDKVTDYYKTELKGQGWEETTSASQQDDKHGVHNMLGEKKGNREMILTVTSGDEGLTIVVITVKGK